MRRFAWKLVGLAVMSACGSALSKGPESPKPADTSPAPPPAEASQDIAVNANKVELLESPQFALVMMACPLRVGVGQPAVQANGAPPSDPLKDACAPPFDGIKVNMAFADATSLLYHRLSGDAYKGSPALQLPSTGRTATSEIEIPSVVDVVSRGFEQLLIDRLKLELQQVAQQLLRKQLKEVEQFLPATAKLLTSNTNERQSLAETLRAALISDILGIAARAAEYETDGKTKIALTTIAAFLQGGDLMAVLQRMHKTAPNKAWANAVRRAITLARYVRQSDEVANNGLLYAFVDRKAAELAAQAYTDLAGKESQIVEIIAALRSARRSLEVMADASLSDETRARAIVAFAEQSLAAIDQMTDAGGSAGPLIDRGAVTRAISAVAARDLPTFVAEIIQFVPEWSPARKAMRLISLGAELSRATSAEAAAQTIASFTTGTMNVRRRVRSVRVAAMVGANAGIRWLGGAADNSRYNVWQGGLSALVGIEAAFPLSEDSDRWIGVTVTGLDGLAALTYDRATSLEAGEERKTKFTVKSLFAPGVLAQIGDKHFSAGLAFNVLPNGVDLESEPPHDISVFRLLLTVGVSIPILELGSL